MSTSMNNPGPDGLRLRPMREDDLPTVMLTERRSYTLPWSEATFQRELGDISNSHLLIVEDISSEDAGGERHIVGHGCWWEVVDECHITNVTVSPDVRRRGVGQFLLEGIINQARRRGAVRATLEVRLSNAAAVGLYEKFGFTSVAMRRKYYPDNEEDALVMWKEKL